MMRNKRGMIDGLVVMGYSLIVLAILIGVGLVVLQNFANTVGAGEANTSITKLMRYIDLGVCVEDITWILGIIAAIGMSFLISSKIERNKGSRRI